MKRIYFIILIFFIGCTSKRIFVYEKIPKDIECYKFKEYVDIESCSRKQQIILNKKLSKVVESDNSRKIRKFKHGRNLRKWALP